MHLQRVKMPRETVAPENAPKISADVHYPWRCSMSEQEVPSSQQDQLALAIAQGKSVTPCGRNKTTCPGPRPSGGPRTPMSAAKLRTGAAARSIGLSAGWPAIPCGPSNGSPSSEKRPSPSRFSSGRCGPSCTTRWPSPSFRILSTAWPSSRRKSVERLRHPIETVPPPPATSTHSTRPRLRHCSASRHQPEAQARR